jgi:hypothetical protein
MTAQVIFLPPFAISYEEARENQTLQEKINSERARFNNWSIGKSRYEIAQALMAWRKRLRDKIFIVPNVNELCNNLHALASNQNNQVSPQG